MVTIRELMAWELDEYSYRTVGTDLGKGQLAEMIERAKQKVSERSCNGPCEVLLEEQTSHIQHLLAVYAERPELRHEYDGLEWTLGVVDLHHVLAFQRRLVFDPESQLLEIPPQGDWPALLSLSLGMARSTEYSMTLHEKYGSNLELSLQSDNPDLQLRPTVSAQPHATSPFSLYGGSPFFEVAEFRGRWFLRDGYHRAYSLLRAGVHHVPAVVIRARTIEEVGATQPWFFDEERLFSSRPPHVTDFLDDDLVLCYPRQRFRKIIHIKIHESLQPMNDTDEVQGDEL
jgi:hypothetical protein